MLEILFILLMLGMVGATLFVGLRERKLRLAAAKSTAKSPKEPESASDTDDQLDGFSSEAPGQFEFNPDEFKK